MITITHTHEGGTLVEGSRKGDGVYEILKGLYGNWRYFPSLRQIGIGQSRDKAADTYKINRAAEALRAAGHEVSVEIDESKRRTVAEIEADRAGRAEARADGYQERAGRLSAAAAGTYARARQMAEVIPFGQPILTDHYSAGRDRRYRDRIGRTYERAFEGMAEAERLAGRAQAAEANQSHRESVPTTLRRIEGLEADERMWERVLKGEPDAHTRRDAEGGYRPAEGAHRERVESALEQVREELAYWRGHVARKQAEGVKVWSREDFARGDFVQFLGTWYEVLRVSAKSVTIPAMISDGPVVTRANSRLSWTDTIPYHKVKGRKSADEMAEVLAQAGTATA